MDERLEVLRIKADLAAMVFKVIVESLGDMHVERTIDITNKIFDGIQSFNVQCQGERWLRWRPAAKKLNNAELGINFFGNLFPYLRKKGALDGLCKKVGRSWLYDTEGIAARIKAGEFDYKQKP